MVVRLSNLIAIALLLTCSIAGAELPTVEQVLDTYRANREKLSTMHVRLKYRYKPTEARQKFHLQQAERIEAGIKTVEAGGELPKSVQNRMTRRQFVEHMRQAAQNTRDHAEITATERHLEFFIDGDNYQVRAQLNWYEKTVQDWKFPAQPATGDNLPEHFSQIKIYSRVPERSPAAQIWPGKSSPNRTDPALLTDKHLWETEYHPLPPMMETLQASQHRQHLIDQFFSGKEDQYQVVGTEDWEGRPVMIVDAEIPSESKTNVVDEDGKITVTSFVNIYRARLDLERGAIPVDIKLWGGREGRKREDIVKPNPRSVLSCKEIIRLANGAFYPLVTVQEDYDGDPKFPPPTTREEWEEIQSGKKILPTVVHERHTWDCSLVEARIPAVEDFFVLKFPEGYPLFNLDTGKTIDALVLKNPVKAGQPAPPWKIARWLDGKEHSLEEFRGKVVFVDFWGLWCGACLSSTPTLKALQEKYKDQPVVFVSIHSADYDNEVLAKRIEDYMQKQNWNYLTAIDAGTMTENSQTSYAYGIRGYPTEVVIGADGIIKFSSAEPPEGMADLFGKSVSKSTEDDRARMQAFAKKHFEEAGVEYPANEDDIPQEEMSKRMRQVHMFHTSRYIDAALEDAGLIQK